MNDTDFERTSTVGGALANGKRLLETHPDAAAKQAREIIRVEPGIAEAHLLLAEALRRLGDSEGAARAKEAALQASRSDPVINRALGHIAAGQPETAELLLRKFLADTPNDPEGLRLLAQVAMSAGRLDTAEQLLRASLHLVPSNAAAKADLERLIERQGDALTSSEAKPEQPPSGTDEFAEALRMNEEALAKSPDDPKVWLSYGHVLRIAGRQEDCIAAYRKALALRPSFGEAWWSLADLKTVRFDERDIAEMSGQLEAAGASEDDATGMHFALGKALEDAERHPESFHHYATGNSLKRKSVVFEARDADNHVRACEERFTRDFFEGRQDHGSSGEDPIFIVGMPRSGSTLVEQILASHSAVEGTEELVYLGNLANVLADGRRAGMEPSPFVDKLAQLSAKKAQRMGDSYLWNASRQRRSKRPRFVDKAPRNWLYLPLIRLALPKAKVIDIRRHPLDCCWSNFRQLFADSTGFGFSYDLAELGSFYRTYVRMLAHFDAASPGMVHRIIYEDLVSEPEREIRRMLDYLELPYESACMEFHRNPRAVKTSSSEQVRQPISDSGIGQWKPYSEWLGPLRDSLEDVLECYPKAPPNWAD